MALSLAIDRSIADRREARKSRTMADPGHEKGGAAGPALFLRPSPIDA
jgi:hypothetical protein